jgi:SIR2-like domain
MSATSIPWDELVRRIDRKELTPFLGAGISRPPLPNAEELAAELARAYDYPFRNKDLMQVAQYAATLVDGTSPKVRVQEIIERASDPDFTDPLQPHVLLASLPILVYLTTNYDDYMEKALAELNRTARAEVCRWNSGLKRVYSDRLSESEPEVGRPVVFHLHGFVGDPDSFVLTEDDYLDFMVNARRYEGTPDTTLRVIPPKVDELISLTSLMFLGYGLRDWNLRVLLRALVQSADRSSQKISVSVQLEPDDSVIEAVGRDAAIKYLEEYFEGLKIRVYWGKVEDFLAELKERWDRSRIAAGEAQGRS